MAITVLPANENAGAIAGWDMLAQAARQLGLQRRQQAYETSQAQKVAYQSLIKTLSDPNTTEDQQNAILSQDPQQFLRTYGVPKEQVGRDISTFKGGPGVDTPAAREFAAESGAPMENKRVLVAHPGGTPEEQAAAANLAMEKQKLEYYRQGTRLADETNLRERFKTRADVIRDFRTADGKTLTNEQADAAIAGTFDVYPTTEANRKLESLTAILGGDPNNPAVALVLRELMRDQDIDDAKLAQIKADTDATRSLADFRDKQLEYLKQGINPENGKPLTGGTVVDPRELIAANDAFAKALSSGFGPIGFGPSQMTTSSSAVPWGAPQFIVDWFTTKTADNPALAHALFGSGSANPADVRRDLLAAIPAGKKLKTITFPVLESKKGGVAVPGTRELTLDEAVQAVTQMRRAWTTSLPGVFNAMRAADRTTLVQMANGNPLILDAARAYAPDVSALIDKARKELGEEAKKESVGKPTGDATLDFLGAGEQEARRELDDLKKRLGGLGTAPTGNATDTRNRLYTQEQ